MEGGSSASSSSFAPTADSAMFPYMASKKQIPRFARDDKARDDGEGTVSIARALSKLGHCSRAEGERLVAAGRVRVNGAIARGIATRVVPETDRIEVDGSVIGKT